MKNITVMFAIAAAICVVSCNKVAVDVPPEQWIDESPIIQFKDPEFLKALLVIEEIEMEDGTTQVMDVDVNKDGKISEKEASVVKALLIPGGNGGGNISDISEIKYFTALNYLFCRFNELTSIDLSSNIALTYIDCSMNYITSLDVSSLEHLTYLNCFDNRIESLDLGNNRKLSELWCYINRIETLDLSNSHQLTKLNCDSNELTSLDVRDKTALTFLTCSNNRLTSLNVSGCVGLKDFRCSENQLTSLDISDCLGLSSFSFSDNRFEKIIMNIFQVYWEKEILAEYGDIITYEYPEGWQE